MTIRGKRSRGGRGRGRGRTNPQQPSQSRARPSPPPHALLSPGEDEELQLIREKGNQHQLLRQEADDVNNVKKGALEAFSRRHVSWHGLHNDLSRHRSPDNMPSSKDVQPDYEKTQSSCYNNRSSKRPIISRTTPNSSMEPSNKKNGRLEAFSRRNTSSHGLHKDLSRHRSLDDVPSSKELQPDADKTQSSFHNASASKRPFISTTRPNSSLEPNNMNSELLMLLSGALEEFSRRNNSQHGLHNDLSRHRCPDDVPSSKDVVSLPCLPVKRRRGRPRKTLDELVKMDFLQPDSDKAQSSSHIGRASKRPAIANTRPSSSVEPSNNNKNNDAVEAFSRRNSSWHGLHQNLSRHSSPDDVPSSEDVQLDSHRTQSSSHNGSASKRPGISSPRPNSSVEPSNKNNGNTRSATSDYIPHSVDPQAVEPTSLPLNRGSHIETDRRKVISIEATDNPRRFVPQTVTRDIISTVMMRMPTPVEKWKKYPIDVKDDLFRDFMDKYKFASDYDRKMARTVWERTCLDRFPDHLKNARNTALKQVNSTNLADTKGHGPRGMNPKVWDGLVDIWLTPEWKKKSDANRINRAAVPDSVLHTGGSISFAEHKRRMEEEVKHPISLRDVYDHVHKKKDGEYISEHSKNYIESYDTLILEKYGEDSSVHPSVDSKVWAEVLGPNKRKAFGGRFDIGGTVAPSSSNATGPSRILAPTQQDIKEAVNAAMTSFVQTQLMPMFAPILSMINGSQARNLWPQGPSQGRAAEEDSEDEY